MNDNCEADTGHGASIIAMEREKWPYMIRSSPKRRLGCWETGRSSVGDESWRRHCWLELEKRRDSGEWRLPLQADGRGAEDEVGAELQLPLENAFVTRSLKI